MARAIARLTALKVHRLRVADQPKPGMYHDGGGLYLRVTPEGTLSWVLRFMCDRKPATWELGRWRSMASQTPLPGRWKRRGSAMTNRPDHGTPR